MVKKNNSNVLTTVLVAVVCILLSVGSTYILVSKASQSSEADLVSEYSSLETEYKLLESSNSGLASDLDDLNSQFDNLNSQVDDAKSVFDIKADIYTEFIEVYRYSISLAYLEGYITDQQEYWDVGDVVYIDSVTSSIASYQSTLSAMAPKLNRLIDLISDNSDLVISGLDSDLDSVSELEDYKAGLYLQLDLFEDFEQEIKYN